MEHIESFAGRRAVAAAEIVTLAGFAGYVATSGSGRAASATVMAVGALLVCATGLSLLRHPRERVWRVVVAVVSALGLVGAVAYLHSLANEPTAIPLAGIGVLMLSLAGLIGTVLMAAAGGIQDSLRR